MPERDWSNKRERLYDQIRQGLKQRGRSEDTAEETAARRVNKERARAGEPKTHNARTSTAAPDEQRRTRTSRRPQLTRLPHNYAPVTTPAA
jgi:hypothetical protein